METPRTQTTFFNSLTAAGERAITLPVERETLLRRSALATIVLLGGALRFVNLDALGYVNHYYAAAVEAMLQSWHNFFFVAAEPGGSVSVDKPPVGLWLQTISAHFFGVNTFGLLLPEILAGLISVVLVYHLVRRRFGTPAGLLAALVLATTPVTVATDRNNTIDSILILTLLLAGWAFIAAAEQGGLRQLLLGAALVGIAFNVKMLEAFLPLPAFYTLYFLGSRERLWRKGANLVVASILLAVVSLSWVTIVDLVPVDQRPYVGSSGDNSEMSLAIGYNGVERLIGMGGRGGIGAVLGRIFGGNGSQFGGARGGGGPQVQGTGGGPQGRPAPNRGFSRTTPGGGASRGPGANGPQGTQRPPSLTSQGSSLLGGIASLFGIGAASSRGVQGGLGGMDGTGQPGLSRLFSLPLAKDIGWLLPFALFGAVVLAFRARPRWPLAPKHQALMLWGGWLLTGGAFFSVAGFFHEYYLSTLAAPLAALVGIGAGELWRLRSRAPWLASALLLAAAAWTLRLQAGWAEGVIRTVPWLPWAAAALAVGAALLVASRWIPRAALGGFAFATASILVAPAIWSGLTTLHPAANQSLPAAYDGRSDGPIYGGGVRIDEALLRYLQEHTSNTKYLMAVPSSMQGSDYVLATRRPVLYLGGFMGQDRVVTPDDLSRMVADGELRYIYWNSSRGGFRGFGGNSENQSEISSWVASNCAPVQGFDTQTQNSGAPDGTSSRTGRNGGGFSGGPGGMQVSLYQCSPAPTQ